MKKLFLLLSFFFAFGLATANAQSCAGSAAGKSCCASKAAKAAALDNSIEKRTSDNGTVSYVRKEQDQQGNVRFVSVQYNESSNTFVNVAPPTTISANDKATMTKKQAGCTQEAGAAKKSSCASGAASGKACCSKTHQK